MNAGQQEESSGKKCTSGLLDAVLTDITHTKRDERATVREVVAAHARRKRTKVTRAKAPREPVDNAHGIGSIRKPDRKPKRRKVRWVLVPADEGLAKRETGEDDDDEQREIQRYYREQVERKRSERQRLENGQFSPEERQALDFFGQQDEEGE